MPAFTRLLLVAGGLFLSSAAWAQNRSVNKPVLVGEAQVELALPNDDYVLVGLGVAGTTDNATPNTSTAQLRLSYEHFWNKRWSAGATLRVISRDDNAYSDFTRLPGNVIPGLLLRHSGQLGQFNFGQRLGAEYLAVVKLLERDPPGRVLTRLRLDVDRSFALGGKLTVRPRLAYEAAAYLRLQRDEGQEKERVIDFGSLRAETGLRLSPRFDLTPWLAYQTHYTNSLPQFDANGNQIRGGRFNVVVPTLGLDLRLTLLARAADPERRQLPTQH